MSGYDDHYFLGRDIAEVRNYAEGRLREDQLACFSYALGCDGGFESQVRQLLAGGTRTPRLVLDVGAGRGELSAAFALCEIPVIGIEPADVGAAIYGETLQQWARTTPRLVAKLVEVDDTPDTVIFCESLEHIPEDEFEAAWPTVCGWMGATKGRVIIANWRDNHPIAVDKTGWDHVRRVDDALYDRLSQDAKRVVHRSGSHLVLEW